MPLPSSRLPISIDELLSMPEGLRVEFKRDWNLGPTSKAVLKTICAFANDYYNVDGGYVVLGVEDDQGTAKLPPAGLDLQRLEMIQKQINGQCRGRIKPDCELTLSHQVVGDRHLLVIWVPRSRNRPHSLQTSDDKRPEFYFREGPEDRIAKGQVLNNLRLLTTHVPFDEERAAGYTIQDLRGSILRDFLQDVKGMDVDEIANELEIYRRLRVTIKINGEEVPRNAALLFFSNEPKEVFPGASVRCGYFPDGLGGDVIEEQEFAGPLHQQVKDCVRYLKKWMTQQLRKHADRPETTTWWTYPEAAIKEAVANAVHHRDYRTACQPTLIRILPDLVQITSYPGPVPGTTPEHFRPQHDKALPPARNPLIGDLLRRCGLAEQWGSGVGRIFRAMAENGSPEPRFEFDDTKFTVELPIRKEPADERRAVAAESRPLTILHLSDFQFGTTDSNVALEHLDEDLRTLHHDQGLRPDLLVVTGDLTRSGRRSEFEHVLNFFQELVGRLELTPNRVVVVPGNHDVNRSACQAYFSQCDADEREPQPPYWPKWQDYTRFVNAFFRAAAVEFTESEPWHLFVIDELRVVVAGLNSTIAESHRHEDHYGWLGERQLRWFHDRLEPYRERGWLRIAALHHSVTDNAGNLRDADALREILGPCVNLIFHGHTHDGKLHWLSPRKLPVLSTGYAAANKDSRAEGDGNRYQIVRIHADRICRWTGRYAPDRKRWTGDLRASEKGDRWWDEEPADFEAVAATLLAVAAPEHPDSVGEARAQEARGEALDDFLSRVQRICRLRESEGAVIERIPHRPLDYLRVTVREGEIARIYPLAASPGGVDEETLEDFLGVHRQYLRADPSVVSVLVYGGDPAPAELIRRATAERVQLRSFPEYQGMIDFRHYLAEQTQRLSSDRRYSPRLYVPQRMRFLSWGGEQREGDALELLRAWLAEPWGRFALVLGDFGTGKTFLLHELARRMGEEGGAVTPILIEMRDLEKGRSLDELIAQHLARAGMERINLRAFRYMLEQGRIALLFDGFDELLVRVSYDRVGEHLSTLLQAARGEAKVVVTSRTQHFLSDQQVKTALGERIELLAGHRIACLKPFDEQQIHHFLINRFGDEPQAQAHFKVIVEVNGLLALAHNPRLLSFIADLSHESLEAAREKRGNLSAADVYELLLQDWLGHEYERLQPAGAQHVLTVEDRWQAVTQLAVRMWERGERAVSVDELNRELSGALHSAAAGQLSEGDVAHQVGSGTLLVRDAEGAFSFLDPSVPEWLVARRAAEELAGSGASDILRVREISPRMADFLCDLAGRQHVRDWSGKTFHPEAGGDKVAERNARLLLDHLGEPVKERFAGRDLRGRDLSEDDLSGADLREADLSSARLIGTILTNARLRKAKLVAADLSGADLRGVDLRQADLSRARLLGADLRGARLDGSNLSRAKLVGVKIDHGAFAHARLFGAALPQPESVQPWSTVTSPCHAVAWRCDGTLLATGHDDGSVRIWEFAGQVEINRFLGHRSAVRSVAWSPDGQTLASGADDHTVRIWDLECGENLHTLEGHQKAVWSVAYAPEGKTLASGGADHALRIWDAASGASLRTLEGHGAAIWSVAYAPDGKILASGGADHALRIWDLERGQNTDTLEGHTEGVLSVAWSPDGQTLASGSADQTVRLWGVASAPDEPAAPWGAVGGVRLHTLEGHQSPVLSVAWSPDGQTLAAAEDTTVHLWDPVGGALLRKFANHHRGFRSVAWSPDGQTLAAGGERTVQLRDPIRGTAMGHLGGRQDAVLSLAWSPDGQALAAAAPTTVRLWNVGAGVNQRIFEGRLNEFRCVAWSPDGRTLAAAEDHIVRLWNPGTGEDLRTLKGRFGVVRSVAWSPDGYILAAAQELDVCLWDPARGENLRTLEGHRAAIRSVAWSPEGHIIASAGEDRTVCLWDHAGGKKIHTLEGHQAAVLGVAWSPDGRTLASAGEDRTLQLWDPARGENMHTFEGDQGAIRSVAWSPDGRQLAAAEDRIVVVWDPDRGQRHHTLAGHEGRVWNIAFSADGRLLASASQDGTVRLWDPSRGRCRVVLVQLGEGWVAYTPDGRYKLAGEVAGGFWFTIGLCRFEPGELDPYRSPPSRIADGEPLRIREP